MCRGLRQDRKHRMAKATTDPWVDEDTHLDATPHAEAREIAALAATEPLATPQYDPADFEIEEKPGESLIDYLKRVEVADNGTEALAPAPKAEEVAPVVPAVVVPAEDASETFTYPDGSSLSVEKTKKGWAAALNANVAGVNPEVFYGATKNEMWQNVAAGKINATKKTREQNLKIKLEAATVAPEAVVQPVAQPATHELTADQI